MSAKKAQQAAEAAAGVKMAQRMEVRRISELIPYANNARIHSPEQIELLRRSLREYGFVSPILIDGAGNVIAGHGRIRAAELEGIEEAPCVLVEHLSDAQRRAYILADNRLAELSAWDEVARDAELLRLRSEGVDLTLTGFEDGAIALDPADDPAPDVHEDDFDEDPPKEPFTQPGQLWQLGRHRLVCGDATSPPQMQLCVGDGQLADMVFTDPPYGVAIGDKNKTLDEAAGGKSGRCKENLIGDTLSEGELYPLLKTAFINVREHCAPDACYYVTSPQGGSLGLMMMMMRDAGLPVRHVLMWRKNSPTFSIGRLDYDYQHEPIFYTWTSSHHNFRGGKYRSTVWDFPKPRASRLHPTMKPVELVANAILDGSRPDMIVLDPFGGSGTTLIACEQTGRRCRMMELDPKYCDVIIRRWEALTGEKAVLLNG